MEVQLESSDGLLRQMKVRIPAERVSQAVDARLRNIARRAKIPGFRPGKAPLKLIQSQYGEQARLDVVTDLVRSSYPEAVEQAGVNPAGAPSFEVTAESPGAELEYVASFEIYPEITLGALDSLTVEKPVVEVAAADIDKLVENLRRGRRTLERVERAAVAGDVCEVDFVGRIDGEVFEGGAGKNAEIEIGAGRMLPDLENGLIGHAAGDTFVVELAFPADYRAEDLAGKTAQFEVTIHEVREPRLPEIDEDFLKQHGIEEGGAEALRDKCRAALEKERDKAVRNLIKGQALDGLLQMHPIEVPKALVQREIPRLREEAASRFNLAGVSDEQKEQMLPDEIFEQQAQKRVALGLLVGEVMRTLEIKLDPARVERTLDEMAADYEQPEQVKQFYRSRQDLMQGLRALSLEEQVVETLIASGQVTEKPMSLDELLGKRNVGA